MESVRAWLVQNARPYSTPNRVIYDIESLLAKFPSLRPKAANFTYDNGQTLLLICLEGTLPINFRGTQYNIPVNIWVHRNYPMAPPTSFVVPTTTMVVKPSKHVDTHGRVYMPYLHQWATQPEQSNLLHMAHLMIEIFGQMPPLFSRPPDATPPPVSMPAMPTPNQSPTPPNLTGRGMFPEPTMNRGDAGTMRHPYSYPGSAMPPSVQPGGPGTMGFRPIAQQQPPQAYQYTSQAAQMSPRSEDSPETGKGNLRLNMRMFTGDETPKILAATVSETTKAVITRAIDKFSIPNEQPENYTLLMTHGDQERVLTLDDKPLAIKFAVAQDRMGEPNFLVVSKTVLEEKDNEDQAKRDSLLSGASEKLHRRVYQMKAMVSLEVDQLVLENSELKNRAARLDSGIDQLRNTTEGAKLDCESVIQKNKEILETLDRLAKNPELDANEAIITAGPVYDQLLDLVAHDLAIEDTMYFLAKALDRERIDPASYLKVVRNLAREQFFKKALAAKIRESLNMAT